MESEPSPDERGSDSHGSYYRAVGLGFALWVCFSKLPVFSLGE